VKETYTQSLRLLLQHGREGGWSNDPRDPGGMTNLGVTKRAWEKYVGRPVNDAEMRALNPAKVSDFYYTEYYVKCGADRLPAGLDHAVFDFAVNSGPGRAVTFLQGALGVAADGAFGPVTLSAARDQPPAKSIRSLCDARLAYLKGLANWSVFGNGWGRRVAEVAAEANACAVWYERAPPLS